MFSDVLAGFLAVMITLLAALIAMGVAVLLNLPGLIILAVGAATLYYVGRYFYRDFKSVYSTFRE